MSRKYKSYSRDRSNLRASEEIVYLPEYEVSRRYESLVRLIEGRGFSKRKRQELETEACYLFRELEYRKARKVAHSMYLKNLNNRKSGGYRRG